MLDGIELEKQGVPAAVICTDAFDVSAHTMAATHGIPWYPFAVVAHPIGRRSDPELREMARGVVAQVERLLTAAAAAAEAPR